MRSAAINKAAPVLWLAAGAVVLFMMPSAFVALVSELSLALFVVASYTIVPLLSLLLPMWAAKKGLPAILSLIPLPAGFALGFIPVQLNAPKGSIALCFLLSLVGSVIGQERFKRLGAKK